MVKKITFKPSNGNQETLEKIKKAMRMDETSDAVRFCINFTEAFFSAEAVGQLGAESIGIATDKTLKHREGKWQKREGPTK